jgi:hypothetical protein
MAEEFPLHPKGWKPLTLEQKIQKEEERMKHTQHPFDDLFFTKTDSEKKRTFVRNIAELHGKINYKII